MKSTFSAHAYLDLFVVIATGLKARIRTWAPCCKSVCRDTNHYDNTDETRLVLLLYKVEEHMLVSSDWKRPGQREVAVDKDGEFVCTHTGALKFVSETFILFSKILNTIL
jgi:hypothetical protein